MLMILVGVISVYSFWRKKHFSTQWFQKIWMSMTPVGFLALLAGWFVTEVGRQPFTVYGVLRTENSISPVAAEQVMMTLIGFIVVYTLIFGSGVYYMIKLIRQGPKPYNDESDENDPGFYSNDLTETYTDRLINDEPNQKTAQ